MKTLILYASKNGGAREIARRVANKISGPVTVRDLKKSDIPSIAQYDCVVIGSAIYFGAIRKEAKAFLAQNADALKTKRLGLFLSGMNAAEEQKVFEAGFSAGMLKTASAKAFLGCVYDPKKASAIERFVIKNVTKQAGYNDTTDDAAIAQFADALQEN